jgi:2-polyprenyl-3-methyl-5-hydroxy-6-metoxy-1,4-benzoquinol methylase
MKSNHSISHRSAYENYFSTHFSNYQDLNPKSTLDFYRDNYSNFLPVDKNAKILEIGSGLGKFAFYLRESGYTSLTCIDVSLELVQLAKRYSDIDVTLVDEPMDYLAKTQQEFDFVVMLDVIEHIRKETIIDYLNLVRMTIKPGGKLMVSTENMASPVGGRIQHYLDFTHEYNYSEFSLEQVLGISGFKRIQVFGISDRLIMRPKNIILWSLQKIWFFILKWIYKIERPGSRIPRFFGKELIAIAQVD